MILTIKLFSCNPNRIDENNNQSTFFNNYNPNLEPRENIYMDMSSNKKHMIIDEEDIYIEMKPQTYQNESEFQENIYMDMSSNISENHNNSGANKKHMIIDEEDIYIEMNQPLYQNESEFQENINHIFKKDDNNTKKPLENPIEPHNYINYGFDSTEEEENIYEDIDYLKNFDISSSPNIKRRNSLKFIYGKFSNFMPKFAHKDINNEKKQENALKKNHSFKSIFRSRRQTC